MIYAPFPNRVHGSTDCTAALLFKHCIHILIGHAILVPPHVGAFSQPLIGVVLALLPDSCILAVFAGALAPTAILVSFELELVFRLLDTALLANLHCSP